MIHFLREGCPFQHEFSKKIPTPVIQTEGTEKQFWNKLEIISYEEVHSPSLIVKMKYLLWSVTESLCECEYPDFIYCPESAFWQLCKLVSGLRGYATTGCWPGVETCDLAPVFFVWLASSFFRPVGGCSRMGEGWGWHHDHGWLGRWRRRLTRLFHTCKLLCLQRASLPTVFVSSRAA